MALLTPLLGLSAPPSSRVRTQSVSFSCWLSAGSPVLMVRSMALCAPAPSATGLVAANWLTWRIIASVDLRLERLPGSPGGVEGKVQRSRERVDDLDPGRRLLVGELEVGELTEVDERGAGLGAGRSRRAELLAHRVGLAGADLEEAEGAGRGRHQALFQAGLADRVGNRGDRVRGPGDRGQSRDRNYRSSLPPGTSPEAAYPILSENSFTVINAQPCRVTKRSSVSSSTAKAGPSRVLPESLTPP